jgi:hypothetical protein
LRIMLGYYFCYPRIHFFKAAVIVQIEDVLH